MTTTQVLAAEVLEYDEIVLDGKTYEIISGGDLHLRLAADGRTFSVDLDADEEYEVR